MKTITDLREKGLAAWLHETETETEFDFIDFDFIGEAGPCETEVDFDFIDFDFIEVAASCETEFDFIDFECAELMISSDLHDWQMENCYSED